MLHSPTPATSRPPASPTQIVLGALPLLVSHARRSAWPPCWSYRGSSWIWGTVHALVFNDLVQLWLLLLRPFFCAGGCVSVGWCFLLD
jgi:hypothetical protein